VCDALTFPQLAHAYFGLPSMVSAMVETSQAASGRTSDLPGLAIYSVALFLLMLAWAYFLA
jgi:hypothetical protein